MTDKSIKTGGAEPVDPAGRRAQAHLVRGAEEADPAVRHAVPHGEPPAVAHSVHPGAGPAEPVEGVREGLRQPRGGGAVRHQHLRNQKARPAAQVASLPAAVSGTCAGMDSLYNFPLHDSFYKMRFLRLS